LCGSDLYEYLCLFLIVLLPFVRNAACAPNVMTPRGIAAVLSSLRDFFRGVCDGVVGFFFLVRQLFVFVFVLKQKRTKKSRFPPKQPQEETTTVIQPSVHSWKEDGKKTNKKKQRCIGPHCDDRHSLTYSHVHITLFFFLLLLLGFPTQLHLKVRRRASPRRCSCHAS
jgi:hypothetical protein